MMTANFPNNQGQTPLGHLGLISIRGENAYTFINSLLTNRFNANEPTRAKLCALCQPNGKMIASFIGYGAWPEEVCLIAPKDMVSTVIAKLKLYVLRSKVTISDNSSSHKIIGQLIHPIDQQETITPMSMEKTTDGMLTIVLYPFQGNKQTIQIYPIETQLDSNIAIISESIWIRNEMCSGVLLIDKELSEQYIPQMFHYDAIGGIDFQKGCFPGQEVITRSQYRGQVKRRTHLIKSEKMLNLGQELALRHNLNNPIASIIKTNPLTENGYFSLAFGNLAPQDELSLIGGDESCTIKRLPFGSEPFLIKDS